MLSRLSLDRGSRLQLKLGLAVLASAGVFALFLVQYSSQRLERAYAEGGRSTALAIATVFENDFKAADLERPTRLRARIDALVALEPAIEKISLYRVSRRGPERVVSTDRAAVGSETRPRDVEPISTGRYSYREAQVEGKHLAELSFPLREEAGQRPAAAMGLYYELAPLDRALSTDRWLLAVAAALASLLLALFVVALLRRALFAPLERLRAATHELAAGGPGSRLGWSRSDEIGTLARDFDAMSEELKVSHERLRTVVESAPMVIFALDREGVFTLGEGRSLEALGLRPGEVVGRSVYDVYADSPHVLDRVRRALDGEMPSAVIEAGELSFDARFFPVRDETDEVSAVIGVGTDITERVRAERERELLQGRLAQSQRLESVGQLAGGVAHDFNNLLAVILNYASFVEEELPEGELREDVEEIRRAAERAAALTHQLLVFSRRDVVDPKLVDLNAVVENLEKLLRRTIGDQIDLRTRLASNVPVKADPGQVEQVLVNLAVNARDAMPDGGTLTIASEDAELDEAYARSHTDVAAGRYVRLSVADTGEGMPEEVRQRALEPFFSTKPKDKGTGLGLATVYGIVTQAGGHLQLDSEPGRGTVVSAYLPAAGSERAVPAQAKGQVGHGMQHGLDSLRGGETILVVEDEDGVRDVAYRILSRDGYFVLAARNGADALGVVDGHEAQIDLLLTDVVMPEMSGAQLADRMARVQPELKVLYTSGYTSDARVLDGVLEGDVPFLQKPFSAEQLRHKVRETLGEGREREAAEPRMGIST